MKDRSGAVARIFFASIHNMYSTLKKYLEPNDESGANVDAAKMWREDREQFNKIAERMVRKTLGLPPPE